MNHNIYALTLSWNGKEHLQKLYPSLKETAKQTIGSNLLWYIKDNASTDDTDKMVESWNDNDFVRYFKYPNNLQNFSQSNNYLIEQVKEENIVNSDNDFYLLLNNDIVINDHNSLRYMIDIMDRDKDVGIVGAKLYYPGNKKLIQHFGVAMSLRHGSMPWHIFSKDFDSKHTQKNKMFQAVTGAFLLIRASCFDKLKNGKMDERYNWAFEDIDMCLQVNKDQKKKIVCCAKTNISHFESASLEKSNINKMYVGNNVKVFKSTWGGKYALDYFDYEKDPNFNIYS